MTKFFIYIYLLFSCTSLMYSSVSVSYPQLPIMVNKDKNIVVEICIDNSKSLYTKFQSVSLVLKSEVPTKAIKPITLSYTGMASMLYETSTSIGLKNEIQRLGGGQEMFLSPAYNMDLVSAKVSPDNTVNLSANHNLVKGKNYFYVSVAVSKLKDLTSKLSLTASEIIIDGVKVDFDKSESPDKMFAVSVRNHNDDGVYAYRIPGLVTSNKGTLLAVYDVRYTTALDLQDNVDVGLSRSFDGGLTWDKMQIILDMGTYGGLPEAQNGVGDPSILVDEVTGTIFVVAAWTHGLNGDRAWTNSGPGFEPFETAQLIMTSSNDDGKTWSEPVNLTKQVKQQDWRFLLQGPGRGITMEDGTLVFPIQYIHGDMVPSAAIMYSHDHGQTWQTNTYAKMNTTESQVVELAPGELMLNMRDNNNKGRAIYTTTDMGVTWTVHPTSNGALVEPVCMASIIKWKDEDNNLGKDVLLFSNPNDARKSKRWRMTIKASIDNGDTWSEDNQLLIDEAKNWGYSCMTVIDNETVGILYEGSTSQMVFQRIKLEDIIK